MILMRDYREKIVVLIVVTFFFILYSIYSLLRYFSLNAGAYDLGIYSSALFNTLHGKFFYTNLLNESFLSNHFSPFMFILLGVYYIFPRTYILLIIQSFFIAYSGYILYLIYKFYVKTDKIRFEFIIPVLLYELSPIGYAPIAFDFHLMALLPFFYFLAFYYFLKDNKLMETISLIFLISLHSFFVVIVIFFIFSNFILKYYYKGIFKHYRDINYRKFLKIFSLFILLSLILITYFLFASFMRNVLVGKYALILPSDEITNGSFNSLSLTGYIYELLNPVILIHGVLSNIYLKLELLFVTLYSSGFMMLLSPVTLVPVIPYIIFAVPSSYGAYVQIGYEYTALMAPMVFISMVIGIKKLNNIKYNKNRKHVSLNKNVKYFVIFIVLIFLVDIALNPIIPDSYYLNPGIETNIDNFHINNTSKLIFLLAHKLNNNSTLITQNNVYPAFSNFTNAYELGTFSKFKDNNYTDIKCEYIIGDNASIWYTITTMFGFSMKQFINMNLKENYGLYINEYNITVLKYHYNSSLYAMKNNKLIKL